MDNQILSYAIVIYLANDNEVGNDGIEEPPHAIVVDLANNHNKHNEEIKEPPKCCCC